MERKQTEKGKRDFVCGEEGCQPYVYRIWGKVGPVMIYTTNQPSRNWGLGCGMGYERRCGKGRVLTPSFCMSSTAYLTFGQPTD